MAIFYWKGGTSPSGLWQSTGQWYKDEALTVAAGDYPHNATDIAVFTNGASDNCTDFGEAISIAALIDFTAYDDPGRLTATDYTLTVGLASFLGYSGENSVSIIGNCIFSGTECSNSGTIVGNCIFSNGSDNNGTITGDCIFNGSSTSNYGTITGDCIFSGSSNRNQAGATINGNCIFNTPGGRNNGTINGDCIFASSSRNFTGTITGTCVFKSTISQYASTVNGNAIFHTETGIDTPMNITGSIVPLVPVTTTGTIGKKPLDVIGAEI